MLNLIASEFMAADEQKAVAPSLLMMCSPLAKSENSLNPTTTLSSHADETDQEFELSCGKQRPVYFSLIPPTPNASKKSSAKLGNEYHYP